ncbi:hypothetical protein ACGLWX_04510 [Halomonas sp. HMF6819]|uniref:hypothetical protein n=1 Tax=Halomonas sp. HMF6819 TaxID=3373085 RepID=UPI0037B2C4D1
MLRLHAVFSCNDETVRPTTTYDSGTAYPVCKEELAFYIFGNGRFNELSGLYSKALGAFRRFCANAMALLETRFKRSGTANLLYVFIE